MPQEESPHVVREVRRGDREAFGIWCKVSRPSIGCIDDGATAAGAEEVTQDASFGPTHTSNDYDIAGRLPVAGDLAVRLAENWLRHRATVRARRASKARRTRRAAAMTADRMSAAELCSGGCAAVGGTDGRDPLLSRRRVRDMRARSAYHRTIKTLLSRARRHLRERLETRPLFTGDSDMTCVHVLG